MLQFIDRKSECVVRPAGAVTALGDPDDHLRLAVLLGRTAQQRGHDNEDARACIEEPAWSTKWTHLQRLIDSPSLHGLIFQDIDALWQGRISEREAWADSTFRRERSALFDLLVQGAGKGRWDIIRPVPYAPVSQVLLDHQLTIIPDHDELTAIASEIRPLSRVLIERSIVTFFDIEDIVEAARDLGTPAENALISYADEHLSGLARDAAFRLSLLRIEQPLNGAVGPYPLSCETNWNEDRMEIQSLPRSAIDELLTWGLLHVDGSFARMPRLVRGFYERRAWATGDINAQAEHQWLCRRLGPLEDAHHNVEQIIESHHHAVEGEDLDAALGPNRYYLNDLRQLATRLSQRGGAGNWHKAARIFARITREDPKDAYAWEYWGYNLARIDPGTQWIEDAYIKACSLEPDNPLYRGRLVGWRGYHGMDVVNETRTRIMDEYGPGSIAAMWFAKQVLDALDRGQQRGQIARIRASLGPWRVDAWLKKEPANT